MNFKSNEQKKPTIQIVRKSKVSPPNESPNTEHSKPGTKQIEKKSFGGSKSFAKKKKSLAFVSLELTHNSPNAVIIQMNKLTHVKGQALESTFIYSNKDTPISPEATAHHGLTEYDVRFKRKISDFNLKREDFNVVWDGLVTKKLFWVNEVVSYSRLINLHLLARFFTENRQPIRMINFASISTNRSVEELSQSLKNPLNKLRILPEIYEHIRKLAQERYGEDTPEFLAKISKARTIDDVPKLIAEYLEKKKVFDAKRKNYETKKTAKMINKVEAK